MAIIPQCSEEPSTIIVWTHQSHCHPLTAPHLENQPPLVISYGVNVGHGLKELAERPVESILKLGIVLVA